MRSLLTILLTVYPPLCAAQPIANERLSAVHGFFRKCPCFLRGHAVPLHTSTERQYRKSWLKTPKRVPAESPHPFRLVPTRQVYTLNQLRGEDAFPSLFAALLL
jgi:hypothetical protein